MSIEQALLRKEQSDSQGVIRPQFDETKTSNTELVNRSRLMLVNSGAKADIDELAEIIGRKFSDVGVYEQINPDGSISINLDWNRKPVKKPSQYECFSVAVRADPRVEELIFSSQDQNEYLWKSIWISRRDKVEDALVRAYRKPIIKTGTAQKL